ncbi:hypothetical protein V9T40_006192 [Parthenolecanium corni]|uniref:THAP-type domain-containing protein n=1 Tax=Parthenolecanium corni TaxID=536013 RepID=A0AAN9TVE3_9HEMI
MSCDDKIKIKRLKKDAIPTLHLDLILPVDDERRRIWFQNLGIDEKYPEDRISALKICGEHFSPSDFTINPWSKKKTLKENATPIKVWSSDVRLNSKPPASLIGENSNIGTEIEMTDPDPSPLNCLTVLLSENHSQETTTENNNVEKNNYIEEIEIVDPVLRRSHTPFIKSDKCEEMLEYRPAKNSNPKEKDF